MTTLKPYHAYKDTGVDWMGDIPEHWTSPRLRYLASSIKAGPFGTQLVLADMQGSEYKVYTQQNVIRTDARIGHHFIDQEAYDRLRPFAVESGDILVSARGTIGKSVVVPDDADEGVIHPSLIRVRLPDESMLLSRFLTVLLGCELVLDYLRLLSNATTIDVIYSTTLAGLSLPLPPLDEQRAIADFLDGIDARITRFIAARRKMIALLEEKKQGVINQAVTRGLDPSVPMKDSGVDWLGEIPAHWSVRRLRALSEFITSGSRDWAQYYADDGSAFLRIGNLSTKSIDLKLFDLQYVRPPLGAEGERTRVLQDDILVSITAQMGAVGLVPQGLGTAYINQHTALVRLRRRAALPRFIAYFLLSDIGKQQSYMATNGGTKLGLGLDDVANLLVFLPPSAEQAAIVDHIDRESSRMNALMTRHRREIELMQEYRTRLISDVVTGKLDVRGVELPAVEEVTGEEIEAAMEEVEPEDAIEGELEYSGVEE